MPFSEAIKLFLEDRKRHVADRTSQFERERLKPLSAFFGERPLLRIEADDIAAYQRTRLASGLSGKTINMDIGVLRLLPKRAKCWRIVADGIKMFPKRGRTGRTRVNAGTKGSTFPDRRQQAGLMVAHCAAVLAVSTTCRGVELKRLRWNDVDLFNRVLNVRRSKRESGHRDIPLNADAVAALARPWERAQAHHATNPEHFVFPACENEHVDPAKPQKSWRTAWRSLVKETAKVAGNEATKLAEKAGRDVEEARKRASEPFEKFRFHDLRHQAITEMAGAGASDATIMAVAGHLDRAMMEHYSHVSMAAKRDVLGKLESGLMDIPTIAAKPNVEKLN